MAENMDLEFNSTCESIVKEWELLFLIFISREKQGFVT